MRIFFRPNPRAFVLVSNAYALTIQPVKVEEQQQQTQQQCLIQYLPAEQVWLDGYSEVLAQQFYGLVGVLELKGHSFLCVITDQVQIASPRPAETVYKVTDTEFYCLDSPQFDTLVSNRHRSQSGSEKYDAEHPCAKLTWATNSGFYYSRDFDLTNVLQERGLNSGQEFMFTNYERKYLWNRSMLQELLSFRNRIMQHEREHLDRSELLTMLVRGFVKTFNVRGNEDSLITVISRISCAKSGGPFGLTGVDDDGYVSNFVETEFLFYNKNYFFSYTQIRGNVPIFYEVENPFLSTSKKITFTKSKEMNEMALDKHFESMITKHGNVYVINGLKSKTVEDELSNRYKYFVNKKQLPLFNMDFSKETLKHSPHKVSYLIKNAILEIGAFCYDIKKKVYIGKQLGIFRINTLNSIEKPGMIEKIISKEVLELSLQEMDSSMSSDLTIKHDKLWDENNAAIMAIYERALKKSDKKIYEDLTKSIVKLHDPIHDYISSELAKRENEYTSTKIINIFTGSFNVNGEALDVDIKSWIYPNGETADEMNDIVVIGLEEVVELKTSQMLVTDDTKKRFWEQKIKRCLNQRAKYSLLSSNQLGGIVLLLFVKDDQLNEIKELETTEKKTGFGGMSANKGGVGVSFLYSSTRFCFIASHLAAGLENVEQRHSDYKTIAKNMRFGPNHGIKDHDAIIWCGDFNYRILLPNDQVREAITQNDYLKLFEYDQLSNQMIAGESFPYFNEMEIKFPPTYKFDKGTTNYDTSEKLRIPAWTDRIVSRGSYLTQLTYGSAQDILFSDHRPVYATFKARVKVIDESIKERLIKEAYERRKLEIDNNKLTNSDDVFNGFHITNMAHGLPRPSSEKNKWWLEGGQSARVVLELPPGDDIVVNPDREINPFVLSDIPDFISLNQQ